MIARESFQRRFKGIIFDMDGVLLDSSPLHDHAYREAFTGLPVRQFDYRSVAGMRTDEAVRAVLKENAIPFTEEQVASLASAKSLVARDLIARKNPIAPRCSEVLNALAAQHPLALASSASEATIDVFLTQNGLRAKFVSVLHGGDVHSAKPAPDIYRLACQRLRLSPSECLVIEDAVSGVQAAKAAGTAVWGITTTSTADQLTRAGADRIIAGLEDLLVLADNH